MAKIKIPETFRLLNTTWKVRQDVDEALSDAGNWGSCSIARQEIWIQSGLTPEYKSQVFYHELAHAFFLMSNQIEANADEAVVELMGTMFQQYLDTKRGNINK